MSSKKHSKKNNKVLIIIPARGGSKRIPNKNIRLFLGKPLIAHTIHQARMCTFADRIIVDTESKKIAAVAKKYGAEVPFLRPEKLARDSSRVEKSIIYLLKRLKKEEHYIPEYILLLQTTSPLRELDDVMRCWKLIQKTNATTVLTVCPTHPKFYHLTKDNDTILVNGSEKTTNNTQKWKPAYMLNGCFVYFVQTRALLREGIIITNRTKAVVCPKWRSVDLDTPEDWALAEVLYKKKEQIKRRINTLNIVV